ncbi:hypothetical protein [Tumebacillus flagellatus]|uniref:Spore coat protein n=1 Tax=Tumebacillus flagellatus TaxID=1157490 RepID=A0A074M873_9BACL|nr:hypothetical protein [Tumebacillus flagellatus]KEO82167.1 hypothetical protein EL26_16655 [Tumebacillus flagellatus]
MQPLTAKELEYIVDSMSNEDLLIKQCTAAAASVQNPQLARIALEMAGRHQTHYNYLLNTLQQHQQLAPTQPM